MIPVGVTEVAMVDGKIDLNDVDEVLKLAKILRVDAVVVGAVTEYSPYYPPRIGMTVNWYSPRSWSFYPGIQTEPASPASNSIAWDKQRLQDWRDYQKQLDEQCAPETPGLAADLPLFPALARQSATSMASPPSPDPRTLPASFTGPNRRPPSPAGSPPFASQTDGRISPFPATKFRRW